MDNKVGIVPVTISGPSNILTDLLMANRHANITPNQSAHAGSILSKLTGTSGKCEEEEETFSKQLKLFYFLGLVLI